MKLQTYQRFLRDEAKEKAAVAAAAPAKEAAAKAAAAKGLGAGARVRVKGLATDQGTKYNGQEAEVDADGGQGVRLSVTITSAGIFHGHRLLVKARNLTPL